MAVIAVDMTPALPGGENGGAKIVAVELLRSFSAMVPQDQFILLTASWNHEDLSHLDAPNVRRVCVLKKQSIRPPSGRAFPEAMRRVMGQVYRALRGRLAGWRVWRRTLGSLGVDLLFCPFTAITYAEPRIPVISVIHDLQHLDYPQFFSASEIAHRDSFFSEITRRANAVICVSEFTRQAVLNKLKIKPQKAYTVHNCIHTRFSKPDESKVYRDLESLGIDRRPYMFYPANFWPHKNHMMLLTAFGMFLSRNPESQIDLVFTGALDDSQEYLKDATCRMGLSQRVHFLGFLGEDQLMSVWSGCRFLIFPSLYEGFGMPVLEAMYFGKPALCSNVASLPEVAGDAAMYFDPRKPSEIVECMEKILKDDRMASELIRRGNKRVARFAPEAMAQKYMDVFDSTIKNPGHFENTVTGVYQDGWTDKEMVITYGPGQGSRFLEIVLEAPSWLPHANARITVMGDGKVVQRYRIARGASLIIRQDLPERDGLVSVFVSPLFVPSQCDMGEDGRSLGVMCRGCWLTSSLHGRMSLLKEEQ